MQRRRSEALLRDASSRRPISGARRSLYITDAYFAPDGNMLDLLVAAARRGVDVRVLTAGPPTDVRTVPCAGHAIYEKLLEAGAHIYEWNRPFFTKGLCSGRTLVYRWLVLR